MIGIQIASSLLISLLSRELSQNETLRFLQMNGIRGLVSLILFYSVLSYEVNTALSFSSPFTRFNYNGTFFALLLNARKSCD